MSTGKKRIELGGWKGQEIPVAFATPEEALLLREAVNTYLRLFALADAASQEVCEQFIAAIDEELRGSGPAEAPTPVTLSPTSAVVPAVPASHSFEVTMTGTGTWAAQSDAAADWLKIDSPTGEQSASGTVTYSVADHSGTVGTPATPRTANIKVNDVAFPVTQGVYDVMPVSISPMSASPSATGGTVSYSVASVGSGISNTWTVYKDSGATWLTITSPPEMVPQSLDGDVLLTIAPNSGAQRVGNTYTNGQTFTVTQAVGGSGSV